MTQRITEAVPSAEAGSAFFLQLPGTYVPGYLNAAAARLM